jgi:hypothetical protein
MKIKVIMDSGKEYFSEKDDNIEALLTRGYGDGIAGSVNYITLDRQERIAINTAHISSVELVED